MKHIYNKYNHGAGINPTDVTLPLAYRVPENILGHQKMMRVYSKYFVRDVMRANQFAQDSTYTVYGKYYEKEKVVLFDLRAAFENRMASIEADGHFTL